MVLLPYDPTPRPGFEPGYPCGNKLCGIVLENKVSRLTLDNSICAIPGYATAAIMIKRNSLFK